MKSIKIKYKFKIHNIRSQILTKTTVVIGNPKKLCITNLIRRNIQIKFKIDYKLD